MNKVSTLLIGETPLKTCVITRVALKNCGSESCAFKNTGINIKVVRNISPYVAPMTIKTRITGVNVMPGTVTR